MAVSGNFTNCNCGPDVPACANPTEPVATVGLCLTDGTPIAVTVVRDCAGTVTQEGWIDLTTGVYTAGPPPEGAAACDTGCVDTVCVQRCDDTDGDGAADQTYSELWCIRADGTATLVLTYQDDPSTPYTPTSPVECQYGCPETETVQLCDDAGPFLRRYTWLGGTATFEDFALDGVTPHVVTGSVRACAGDGGGDGSCCPAVTTDTVTLCDTAADGTVTSFLRHLTYTEGATVPAVTDTALDGVTPYTPAGTVGTCGPGSEPCRDSSSLLLCDATTASTPVTPAVDSATLADTGGAASAWKDLAGPTGALWAGGTLVFPADPNGSAGDGVQVYRAAVGRITASPDNCTGASGTVTVSARVRNDGPAQGAAWVGGLYLRRGATELAGDVATYAMPVGAVETLTATANVTAEDLASGDLYVLLLLETFQIQPKSWTADQFTVTADLTGCTVQFLRTVTVDCATGETVSTVDTTLDGQPYTVTGEVGQCQASGGDGCCPEKPCPAQNVLEVCRCDDTTGDGSPDTEYTELLAVDCDGNLTSLGTYTVDLAAPYTPVAPVPCEAGTGGADPALGVQAGRVQLAVGDSWNAATVAALQSVTVTAHTGPGQITTSDGTSTLFQGETVTWSTNKEGDALLTGPLTVTAVSGIVTVTYTRGITL
ncbi:hypothetical protein ABT301_29535 [Streptomyces sp. NPDC000987]|uniref:hypothetical protein n=1 Tax=Streptomyces sp. NPDC000987 TaxID=3154374 RepID=UPI00332D8786